MTTGLDTLKPYADAATANSARKIEERRHGGWLLELERALLAKDSVKSAFEHRHGNEKSHRSTERFDPGSQPLPHNAAGSAMTLPEIAAASDQANPAAMQDAESVSSTSMKNVAAGGNRQDDVSTQQEPSTDAAASADLPPAGHFSAVSTPLHLIEPNNEGHIPSVAQNASLPRVALQSSIGNNLHFTEPQEQGESEQAPAASHDTEAAQDNETYTRRKLHLYHGEDGVHAWIRDIDVSEPGVHAIARALNDELATSGMRLAALTLNGKKLAHLFQDATMDEQFAGAATGHAHSKITQQITRKGEE